MISTISFRTVFTLFHRFAMVLFPAIGFSNSIANAAEIKVPVSRDTWVSTVGSEGKGNNGASPRLKIKSIQEFTIIDLDPEPLRGKRIRSAKLFLKVSGDEKIDRVSISTITSDWNEGTGQNYQPQEGASTFLFQSFPNKPMGRWRFDICLPGPRWHLLAFANPTIA